jgi:acyl-CoA synthetase (AMP-forming)/AMP-acid ligase II
VLDEVVRRAAVAFGDRPAIVQWDGEVLTYGDLDQQSDELAAGLAAHGVGEEAVVALTMPSVISYVVAYTAAAKAGACAAGVNPRLTSGERAAVLDRLAPDLVLDLDAVRELTVADGRVRPLPSDPERLACVVFTSGTTGAPKGAVFRNRHLAAVDRIDAGGLADGSGGPMLASTQFAHIGFMTKLPWYLRLGATLHVLERWRAEDALDVICRERMTSIGGVAAQIALLLRVPDFDRYDVSSVRTIVVGAGPSPAAVVCEARERFGAAYSIRYSSTESGGVGTGTAFDADDEEALHTVGRPRPGVEARVDESTGEVLLRSPAVMDGYWREPERTRSTLVDDGWLRTGDLGALDERGCLRLVGRASDVYIRGGYNVHPIEVESVLVDHPAIAQVVVVPRDDPVMGEIGEAVVVVVRGEPAPTLDELRAFAAGRLASYKLPERLRVVDELPLTTMDKVDRRALA